MSLGKCNLWADAEEESGPRGQQIAEQCSLELGSDEEVTVVSTPGSCSGCMLVLHRSHSIDFIEFAPE